ncbi:MAG: type II secretion system F family protein, partial [archaeon]
GGILTYALNNIVDTIKSRVELKRHIKAITAQGKFTAILLGVIPLCMFFLLNLVSKGYFDNMFNTGIGRIMIILALILDGFGTFVTFKIASPKIKNF